MEADRWERLREVFEQVAELPLSERSTRLDELCGPDAGLRAGVERMLAWDSDDFGEAPPVPDVEPALLAPGARLGAFELVRVVASGGMGTVFEARQENPRRRVALKVMNLGFGHGSARRRFAYEAEVLARLRHPGIAQIFEAGVHRPAGPGGPEIPYFAMEYVEDAGDLIATAQRLGLALGERLELFLQLTEAVHHGHQQGIVHRDLKPANVLVDRSGRVKVIDFGVARAVGGDGPDGTLLTRAGELVGTLAYMAPEQLTGDPAAVDTRSDVYALGLLLYQLVCGRPPYDLEGVSLAETARIVREEPPLAPRRVQPSTPEDLEWILLRALEKEPDRRYASVSELAADVRRLMAHEPVLAGPPSTTYRLRKFVRRNRLAVGAGTAVVVALAGGTTAASIGLVRAEAERQRAEDALVLVQDEADKFRTMNTVLEGMLTAVRADRDGRDVRVVDLLDRAAENVGRELADRPAIQASLRHALGRSYLSLHLAREAAAVEAGAHATLAELVSPEDPERLAVLATLCRALEEDGRLDEAEALLAELPPRSAIAPGSPEPGSFEPGSPETGALEPWYEARLVGAVLLHAREHYEEAAAACAALAVEIAADLGPDAELLGRTRLSRVHSLRRLARHDEAERVVRELLAEAVERSGAESVATARVRAMLGTVLLESERPAEAQAELEAAVAVLEAELGEEYVALSSSLNDLALAHQNQGHLGEAYALYGAILSASESVRGPENRETLTVQKNLAVLLALMGDIDASIEHLRAVLDAELRAFGADSVRTAATQQKLGVQLATHGDFAEAEELLAAAHAFYLADRGEEHPWTIDALFERANLLLRQGRFAEAEPLLERARLGFERALGPDHRLTLTALGNHATALANLGRIDEAIALQAEAVRRDARTRPADDESRIIGPGSLASMYALKGDYAEALRILEETLAYAEEHFDAHHPRVVTLCVDLGQTLFRQGRMPEAAEALADAVRRCEQGPRVPPRDVAFARLVYAVALANLGRHAEAEPQLVRAFEGYRDHVGADAPDTLRAAGKLADLYAAWGRPAEASAWRERAVARPAAAERD